MSDYDQCPNCHRGPLDDRNRRIYRCDICYEFEGCWVDDDRTPHCWRSNTVCPGCGEGGGPSDWTYQGYVG